MQELPLSLRDRPLVVRTSTDRCERQVEPGGIVIRPAVSQEQDEIVTLVRSERMNPFDLDWRRFLVATDRSGIVATVQLRHHGDGSRELGSLVVRKDARRRNVASRLIGTLLASAPARVFMITGAAFAAHYRRWGFKPIEPLHAPWPIMRNYFFGTLYGIQSWLAGRRPNTLAILERNGEPAGGD